MNELQADGTDARTLDGADNADGQALKGLHISARGKARSGSDEATPRVLVRKSNPCPVRAAYENEEGIMNDGELNSPLFTLHSSLRQDSLQRLFDEMMTALFNTDGATLDINLLRSKEAQDFIDAHARALNAAFAETKMSDTLRRSLERSDWIFSGVKTFHELNEAFPSLLDENGDRKPFERFLNDVQKINETYNRNYLRAEYNFAHASAQMAAKWEQYEKDGDRYNLQYRTAGDERVREEHAALNGITLPPSDGFWKTHFPPNGWNCFVGHTPVLTAAGWKFIKDIKEGDLVVGGSGKYRKVIARHSRETDAKLVTLGTERAFATCTDNHRFLTARGWKASGDIDTAEIIVQVGEVSALGLFGNAVHNAVTMAKYLLVALVRKGKAVAPLAVQGDIEARKPKGRDIAAEHLAAHERQAKAFKVLADSGFCGRIGLCDGTHALGVSKTRLLPIGGSQRHHLRAEKSGSRLQTLCNAAYQFAVGLVLALANMLSGKGKGVVGGGEGTTGTLAAGGVVDPLRAHGGSAVSDSDAAMGEYPVDCPIVDAPMGGKPAETALLDKIAEFGGIDNPAAINGFNSLYDFLRKSFLHTRYSLVSCKGTKKSKTVVYNLAVEEDESYITPIGIAHNCRCNVVQVRKDKYPTTPKDETDKRLGSQSTPEMFRFNSGAEKKTYPDYNPYTIRRCKNCDTAKGKAALAKGIPQNDLCAACRLLHEIESGKVGEEVSRAKIAEARTSLEKWYKAELPTVLLGKTPARRFDVTAADGTEVFISRPFYKETINKYKTDPMYVLKLEYAKKAHDLIKEATLVNPDEKSEHHPGAVFKVYEAKDDCYKVEMKVRCNSDGNYMHILRVYKK